MTINVGKMTERITLEKYISYKENHITKNKWDEYKTVWASANNLFGKEFWEAKQCNYENVVVFTIRYSKDVADINSKEYRINWKGKLYDIIGVDNVQYSNTFIKLKAKEVVQ